MKRCRALWIAAGLAGAAAAAAVLLQPERWDHWRSLFIAPSERRFPVRGIDVSHHQGSIDWQRVKASGQAFAFIKATEGTDFRDTRFDANWREARAQGVVTGAYHFFTFCSPGLAQAENFLAVAPREERVLPLAVDIEFTGNCVAWESIASIQRELVVFVRRLQASVGQRPLLYTTEEVRLTLIPPELYDHPYWLRSLWGEPSEDVTWQFWQYSATGAIPGIRGEVDLNVFVGPREAWFELVSGGLTRGSDELGRSPEGQRREFVAGAGLDAHQGSGSNASSHAEASSTEPNKSP